MGIATLCSGCTSKNMETKLQPELAPTPPMGWNSWICLGTSATEEEIKLNADFMAENLKESGYEYIVVDAGWYAPGMVNITQYEAKNPLQVIDEYGRLVLDTIKHPSAKNGVGFKVLADYVHSKGLKFGLHIMRGIPIQAVEQNTPIKGTNYRARDIVMEDSQCDWYFGFYGIDMSKPGAQEYYNSLFELYESWEVDYVKADDLLSPIYAYDEIQAIANAIKAIKRPMVLSLSPGSAPIENVKHLKFVCQLWRISEDFWDDWNSLKHQFELCRKWAPHVEKGRYADADMLPIGPIAKRAMRGEPRMANFTPDEQYTMFTLWCMLRSPLMLGCNISDMDDFTLQLVTNKELIAINQHSKSNHQFYSEEGVIGWFASAEDDSVDYVAIFNTGDEELSNYSFDLGILNQGTYVYGNELWTNDEINIVENMLNLNISAHGVLVYKLKK